MVDDRPEIKKKEREVPRFIEDNNSRNALDFDLDNPSLQEVAYDRHGLIPFNYFMHLFLIITRHSKEWHIKEQRKQLKERRRAWKVKDWKTYEKIVQHEIDMERLNYKRIIEYVLIKLQIKERAYNASFVKYSMKRSKDR